MNKEIEFSKYNFELSNVKACFLFADYEATVTELISQKLVYPAYDYL